MQARIEELEQALKFCGEIAAEVYTEAPPNSGVECALRHIVEKARKVLGE